ncbi:MAG: LPS assembly lipoprotein LptE [Parasphingorhabdus sp.]|nr:LPS assembly lipoprotein LptE [Parasphingorhabdus sp.]
MIRQLALIGALAMLSGCGLQPLYSNGARSDLARKIGGIDVDPIAGKAGYLMSGALKSRIGTFPDGGAQYRLTVVLDDNIEGLGIRADDAVTRERRTLRARYQLTRLTDSVVVLDSSAGSDAGIDVVSSEYATIAAEDTALENLSARLADQIITRISLTLRAAPALSGQ